MGKEGTDGEEVLARERSKWCSKELQNNGKSIDTTVIALIKIFKQIPALNKS